MRPLRVFILYEYDWENRPHGSGVLRLIRPFDHLRDQAEIFWGLDYSHQKVDVVIIDRLWCPYSVNLKKAEDLIKRIRAGGARVIYSVDDNFLDHPVGVNGFEQRHKEVFQYFLENADGVIVTTENLKARFSEYASNIMVLPHALDERLLVRRWGGEQELPFEKQRVVIGYMGTFTHNQDLRMILPALQKIFEAYPDRVEFQLIGVTSPADMPEELKHPLVRQIRLDPRNVDYEHFMTWWSGNIFWDIAISPLIDHEFNRSKSDIKFLDYAAVGAAGIFSRLPAYTETIIHLENGLIIENTIDDWENALKTLIEDCLLRRIISRNASKYLYENRILAVKASNWLAAITNLMG